MRQIWGGGAGEKNRLQYFEFGLQYLVQPLGILHTAPLRGKFSHKSAGHNEKCSKHMIQRVICPQTTNTINHHKLSWHFSLKLYWWFCRTVTASDGYAIFVLWLHSSVVVLAWYSWVDDITMVLCTITAKIDFVCILVFLFSHYKCILRSLRCRIHLLIYSF